MIIIIDGINAPHLQSLLKQTYALRARVFKDRLGWDVCVENGMETDVYDTLNPSTLVCIDDDGVVVGSMRILQTTGPNMLADVFSSILQGEAAPRSATACAPLPASPATSSCPKTRLWPVLQMPPPQRPLHWAV